MVFGNATVFVPPDNNPDHGGGPIRRSPHVTVRNDEMIQWALRTPHGVVREHEPGGAVSRYVYGKKFLPDGRLVPRTALGGFGAAPPPGKVDSQTALALLQADYVSLQRVFYAIVKAFNAAKRPIPCDIKLKHNAAVRSHLTAGRVLFDDLIKQGVRVKQVVVGKDGKPALDAKGNPKTLEIDGPLQPGTFVETGCSILGAAAPVQLGVAPLVIIGAGLAVGALIASGVAYHYWPTEQSVYQRNYAKSMDAYLACLKDANKAGVKGQDAEDQCSGVVKSIPKPPGQEFGFWGWLGVGAAVAGAGAAAIYFIRRRQKTALAGCPPCL